MANLIVEPFSDQFGDLATFLNMDETELRRQSDTADHDRTRWLAYSGDELIGLAMTVLRPDDRLFVNYRCVDDSANGPLTHAIASTSSRPLHTNVDLSDRAKYEALAGAGFAVELLSERFEIRFDRVLGKLRRHETMTAWASPSNPLVHKRLMKAGTSQGQFAQLVLCV